MKLFLTTVVCICMFILAGGCHATSNMFGPGPELFGGTSYNTHVINYGGTYWQAGYGADVVGSYADTIPSAVLDVPGMLIVSIRWLFEGKPSAVVKTPMVTMVVSSDGDHIYFNNGFAKIRISVKETREEIRKANPGKSEEEISALTAEKITGMLKMPK